MYVYFKCDMSAGKGNFLKKSFIISVTYIDNFNSERNVKQASV